MNPKLTVLVVSRAFAPDAEIGAKRITRFCTYLPDYGIRPIVLTVQERFLDHVDNDFSPPGGIRVERTTEWMNPLHAYARLRRYFLSHHVASKPHLEPPPVRSSNSNTPSSLRLLVLSLLNTPDRYLGWYFPAIRVANRLLKREPIRAIFSSGPPFTCHLIARHLSKKHGIHWAADFRDGWVTNPNSTDSLEGLTGWPARMEASCVKQADLVICNTEPLRRSFVQRYPQMTPEKFVTLTNGYDDSIKQPQNVKPGQPEKLLLHSGSIYGRRRIDTFLQAVSNLVDSGQLAPDSFRILFLGEIGDSSLGYAHKHAPGLIKTRRIEFEPSTDRWQEAQKLLWAADILLVFPGTQLEVPAKFYEYLKTGKPILAVAEKGALTELVDMTGSGAWADPNDVAGIAQALLKVLKMAPRTPEEVERKWDAQFHFRSLTRRLAGMLQELSAKRATGTMSAGS